MAKPIKSFRYDEVKAKEVVDIVMSLDLLISTVTEDVDAFFADTLLKDRVNTLITISYNDIIRIMNEKDDELNTAIDELKIKVNTNQSNFEVYKSEQSNIYDAVYESVNNLSDDVDDLKSKLDLFYEQQHVTGAAYLSTITETLKIGTIIFFTDESVGIVKTAISSGTYQAAIDAGDIIILNEKFEMPEVIDSGEL
ncbi:MAG: hypothetical protein ATN33_01105 [Epulopiscium sp. Nele67-Bin001]|nr:MAG: hypothetical protein ATN33_01105 [Epulopiscium sp. Nele67-Bin001]